MKHYFGIYGYEITKYTEFGNFILEPITIDFKDAAKLALDSNKFNLTAIGQMKNGPNPEALFDLSGAFTFCQQQWVVVSNAHEFPEDTEIEHVKSKFPPVYETTNKRPSSGALVMSDSIDLNGRVDLLNLCIEKLSDNAFEKGTNFRKAFFRNVESWWMSRQIMDFTYYLDFSALEILSRAIWGKDEPVAKLISNLLNHYGFSVRQDNSHDRHLGMQTYAHLRNSLFHNGEFEKSFNENGNIITLKLNDYADYLRILVPDVLLRILGYDNDNVNWNRWLDRMPFK